LSCCSIEKSKGHTLLLAPKFAVEKFDRKKQKSQFSFSTLLCLLWRTSGGPLHAKKLTAHTPLLVTTELLFCEARSEKAGVAIFVFNTPLLAMVELR
jgi:hypothetical protein